jgi:hypothetical protein
MLRGQLNPAGFLARGYVDHETQNGANGMCDNRKLTLSAAGQVAEVISATMGNAKVARLMDNGDVITGTARSFGDENGMFDFTSDVRDTYLRVTSDGGFEFFWKVSDLMPLVASGEFVIGYQS